MNKEETKIELGRGAEAGGTNSIAVGYSTDAATLGQLNDLRIDLELKLNSKADANQMVFHETTAQHAQITKKQALRMIEVLRSVDGWILGAGQALPDFLHEYLQQVVADLETAVLGGGQ